MADAADDSDLRERVAELEQTVEQQQATIEQLLPSRRRVLQAGGLVAGGGVLGALSADRASAQASGQVGTSSDPVDVEAFDLAVQNQLSSSVDAGGNDLTNVGSVETNTASIGQLVGRAELTTDQSVSTGSSVRMNLDRSVFEDSTVVSVDLSNNKITATKDGLYLVRGRMKWAASADWTTGDRVTCKVEDNTNNINRDADDTQHPGGNEFFAMSSSGVFEVSENTDFIVEVYQDTGGAETVSSNGPVPYLDVVRFG